jgi:inhibitor of KinA sporulation pathway (predicted exonuclease)
MYICVLDFEATCEKDAKNFDNEIIEFPSILYRLVGNKLVYVSEFQEYVKPRDNPVLSEFCIALTKIPQDKVDTAAAFPIVLDNHFNWLKSHVNILSECVIATCGHWDIRKMIVMEAKRWNLQLHDVYTRYINIKDEFTYFYRKNIKGMIGMMQYQGLEHTGILHSGIDDCRNMSRILMKLIQDGHDIEKDSLINYQGE